MNKKKNFDCVAMKDQIQKELLAEWQGMSNEEITSRIRTDLQESQSPLAKWWRRRSTEQKVPAADPAAVH